MNKKNFETILKETRISAGLSQQDIAEALYISRSTYSHYETGRRFPSVDTIIKISAVCHINPLSLIVPLLNSENDPVNKIKYTINPSTNSIIDYKEQQLLEQYNSLNRTQQNLVYNLISQLTTIR